MNFDNISVEGAQDEPMLYAHYALLAIIIITKHLHDNKYHEWIINYYDHYYYY